MGINEQEIAGMNNALDIVDGFLIYRVAAEAQAIMDGKK